MLLPPAVVIRHGEPLSEDIKFAILRTPRCQEKVRFRIIPGVPFWYFKGYRWHGALVADPCHHHA
eukprot:9971606-Karenia_brevis.AAC.1